MKALIAAGGKGTRLQPITFTHNKHLIPIANKPTLLYGIENVRDAGITDIIININPGDRSIEEFLGSGSAYGVHITYVEQKGGPLGLAHIVKNAQDAIGDEDFIFYLGDNIFVSGVRVLIEQFYQEKLDALFAFSEVVDPSAYGVARFDESGKLIGIIEKPKNPPSRLAQTGVYIYNSSIFSIVKDLAPSQRGELEISDANTLLIERGKRVGHQIITGWWKDTGKPKDLLEGNQLILGALRGKEIRGTIKDNVIVEGSVQVGEGTVIESGARTTIIRGPVVIGKNCRISNAHIAPFSSIGDECVIENAEIVHSILMNGVHITANRQIVDSIIGMNVHIDSINSSFPMGHKLLVGDNSRIEL